MGIVSELVGLHLRRWNATFCHAGGGQLPAVLLLGTALLIPSARAEMPEPGQSYFVSPSALPKPGATKVAANPSRIVGGASSASFKLPPGFRANPFAVNVSQARWLAVSPEGDVLLAQPRLGRVMRLKDADGDGQSEGMSLVATGLNQPHGMAFHGGALYIADLDHVWRLPWPMIGRPAPVPITPKGALGDGGGHWTRNIAISPDGKKIHVAIGSRSNIGIEEAPRATVMEFNIDGSGGRALASGLRNPVGISFRPGTSELWTVVNERDGLGDGLVPDYLARVDEGGFFGWPYSYIGKNPQPGYEGQRPDLVGAAKIPDILFRAHSAPLGLAFYDGTQFPEDYRGDAFVALHGSWNSSRAEGYMVARVKFKNGRPAGGYEAFASGFLRSDGPAIEAWGRPVGLAVAKDGSLLIADDSANAIWRISYEK